MARGFALPVVLVLLLPLALLAAAAFGDAAAIAGLAAQRRAQQDAFEAAEAAMATGIAQLSATAALPPRGELAPGAGIAARDATVMLEARWLPFDVLPPGYSSDRYTARQAELRATARAARGARVTLVQVVLLISGGGTAAGPP